MWGHNIIFFYHAKHFIQIPVHNLSTLVAITQKTIYIFFGFQCKHLWLSNVQVYKIQ